MWGGAVAVMDLKISANIETCYFLSALISSLENNTLIYLQYYTNNTGNYLEIYLLKFPVTHRQVHLSAQLGEN